MTGILQDLLSLEAEAQQFLADLQDALHGIAMLPFAVRGSVHVPGLPTSLDACMLSLGQSIRRCEPSFRATRELAGFRRACPWSSSSSMVNRSVNHRSFDVLGGERIGTDANGNWSQRILA